MLGFFTFAVIIMTINICFIAYIIWERTDCMKDFLSKYYKRIVSCLVLALLLGIYLFNSPTSPNNPSPGPAPSPYVLNDDIVPLSNTFESKANFYLFNPGHYIPTFTNVTPDLCEYVGEGKVNFTDDIYNDSEKTASAITSVPDYSSLVTDNQSIEWSTIYNLQNSICVIGIYSDKPNFIASNSEKSIDAEAVTVLEDEGITDLSSAINVCDYGMVGDGVFDNTAIFTELIKTYPTLYIPSGQYLFNSTIAVKNSITLVGESQDSTILLFDNETNQKNWNFQVACDDFSAFKISFVLNKTPKYENKTNIGSTLLKIGKGDNSHFKDCTFICDDSTPYYYNTFWINSDNGPVSRVLIENCTFRNDGHDKIGGNLWIFGCSFPISDVTVTGCNFYHTGWDENVGIWSKESIDLKDIEITDCSIENSNPAMSSDQLMSVLMTTNDSNIKIYNNSFQGEGRINTGIKLKGLGSYVFDSNTISINNQIDDQTNYGYLFVLDSDALQFTNNEISLNQNFTARLRINKFEKFESNSISINAPSLKIDTENAKNKKEVFDLDNSNFNLSVKVLDISTLLSFNGGSIDFSNNTAIYLPYDYSAATIDNCLLSGSAKVNFNSALSNTFEISNCDNSDQISANISNRLLVK